MEKSWNQVNFWFYPTNYIISNTSFIIAVTWLSYNIFVYLFLLAYIPYIFVLWPIFLILLSFDLYVSYIFLLTYISYIFVLWLNILCIFVTQSNFHISLSFVLSFIYLCPLIYISYQVSLCQTSPHT